MVNFVERGCETGRRSVLKALKPFTLLCFARDMYVESSERAWCLRIEKGRPSDLEREREITL